jgi:hypothetical protein
VNTVCTGVLGEAEPNEVTLVADTPQGFVASFERDDLSLAWARSTAGNSPWTRGSGARRPSTGAWSWRVNSARVTLGAGDPAETTFSVGPA